MGFPAAVLSEGSALLDGQQLVIASLAAQAAAAGRVAGPGRSPCWLTLGVPVVPLSSYTPLSFPLRGLVLDLRLVRLRALHVGI